MSYDEEYDEEFDEEYLQDPSLHDNTLLAMVRTHDQIAQSFLNSFQGYSPFPQLPRSLVSSDLEPFQSAASPERNDMSDLDLFISDADRNAAAKRLEPYFELGYLTQEQFEERTAKATAARTKGDLAGLMDNLPKLQLISDADRNAAAKRLEPYFGQGLLTQSDLDARMESVYASRTQDQLDLAMDNLPSLKNDIVPMLATSPVLLMSNMPKRFKVTGWLVWFSLMEIVITLGLLAVAIDNKSFGAIWLALILFLNTACLCGEVRIATKKQYQALPW